MSMGNHPDRGHETLGVDGPGDGPGQRRPAPSPRPRRLQHAVLGLSEAVKAGLFKREYRDHRLEWMIKSGGLDVVVKGLEAGNIRFSPDFG